MKMTADSLLVSPKVRRAAANLVAYLEHDEFNDYLGELPRDHIWHSVKIVRDWLGMPPDENEAEVIADRRAELKEHNKAA
jgi:hypothetical protein